MFLLWLLQRVRALLFVTLNLPCYCWCGAGLQVVGPLFFRAPKSSPKLLPEVVFGSCCSGVLREWA